MLKYFIVSLFLLVAHAVQAKRNEVRLVHPTCTLALDTSYTNDGLNEVLTEVANQSLTKKGYKLTTMADAQGKADPTMALRVDFSTTLGERRGACKAILSLRGSVDDMNANMLLANIVKGKGSLRTVANKCVKGMIKAIKAYPKCSTVLDPEAKPEPPTDGGSNDDGQVEEEPNTDLAGNI